MKARAHNSPAVTPLLYSRCRISPTNAYAPIRADTSTASCRNMVIATDPPSTHARLYRGSTASHQTPRSGIAIIGMSSFEAWLISSVLWARSNEPTALTRTIATRAATVRAAIVRNTSDGKKLGLKNPVHRLPVSVHPPGVSCQDRMPLIQNRLNHAPTV